LATLPRDDRRLFGFRLTQAVAADIVAAALADGDTADRLTLVVTPNTDHIAKLRYSAAFRSAYRRADVIVCDGWPVALYARLLGIAAPRVTGWDIAEELMRRQPIPEHQRFFFVVDSAETVAGIAAWAERRGLAGRVTSWVPPVGFEADIAECAQLAAAIRAHGTTILMMGVGAPRSEVFVSREAEALPGCWAFCVGQAVRTEAGLAPRAPRLLRRLGLEWLWRILREPRRLLSRYVAATSGFLAAVLDDRLGRGIATQVEESER
jgi:N-acetylglucosaminyldiphosphoundecaprenol N-acetyl-beta-D-mannosaminyltransferase